MQFTNCAAIANVFFTSLIANICLFENLRLCSSAEAGIVLKFHKIVLIKNAMHVIHYNFLVYPVRKRQKKYKNTVCGRSWALGEKLRITRVVF